MEEVGATPREVHSFQGIEANVAVSSPDEPEEDVTEDERSSITKI